jgi:hypothetical protein
MRILYAQRAGHDVRLLVVTRFIRLHPGAQKGNAANYWSLFEPHYKQNLYANPKRTAKSSFFISDASAPIFVQIIFPQSRIPFSPNFLSKNGFHSVATSTVRIETPGRQATQLFSAR